jgi:NAD+ synthase (glutamine-hydrolysing)
MSTKLNFKIAVAQMRPKPGNIRKNLADALKFVSEAKAQGAKLIVFGELCLSGYLLGDRWEDESFIRNLSKANEVLKAASVDCAIVFGSIRADFYRIGEDGRIRKYNAALVAQNGKWVHNGVLDGWIPKTNLPNYRMFDDSRHFYPSTKLFEEMRKAGRIDHLWQLLQPFPIAIDDEMIKLGVAICEDLWEDEYSAKPSKAYGLHGVDLLVDISSSPWTADKWHAREGMLVRRVRDAKAPILYANIVGLQNNAKNLVWFDGASEFLGDDGEMRWAAPQNKEGVFVFNPTETKPQKSAWLTGVAENYAMTIEAMRDFYASYGRVIIGLSGGIDSAVSAAMLVEALGPQRILAINMPTEFNSKTTQELARQCAANLGIEYRVIPIQSQYDGRLQLLRDAGYSNIASFDKENIQGRLRGQVQADVTAVEARRIGGKCGFSNNGNKTEVALNYFTEYGDGAGTASFFGDDWKGQVYELAKHHNRLKGFDAIPQGIIDIVPSAELSKDQNVDEGKGDPIRYPYHDKLLQAFQDKRKSPADILASYRTGTLESFIGCESGLVSKYFPTASAFVKDLEWAWMQYSYEGKRHKLPPTLIKTRRAFGFDRRDTIADGYLTDEFFREKESALAA